MGLRWPLGMLPDECLQFDLLSWVPWVWGYVLLANTLALKDAGHQPFPTASQHGQQVGHGHKVCYVWECDGT